MVNPITVGNFAFLFNYVPVSWTSDSLPGRLNNNKPIHSTVFNYNILVTELDIENSIPVSCHCKDSKYCYQPTGHIVMGDLKIITDSRIWSIIFKGPKYRFPLQIDFKSCHEEIADALQEFCNR